MSVKTRSALLLMTVAWALGCGSSVQMTGQWVDKTAFQPGKYSSMFIAVMSQNIGVKKAFEDNLASEAAAHGIKAVKSSDFFKPNFTTENAGNKEAILARVRELGLETIFTVALKDQKTDTRYVPGESYTPAPYYGGYWGYYSYTYQTVYSPGYYTTDKTYYLESNLYDVATEKLLWSFQSETINPGKAEEVAQDYTNMLLDALDKNGLLRKQK
jgi:hypothetical protein